YRTVPGLTGNRCAQRLLSPVTPGAGLPTTVTVPGQSSRRYHTADASSSAASQSSMRAKASAGVAARAASSRPLTRPTTMKGDLVAGRGNASGTGDAPNLAGATTVSAASTG